MCRCGQEEGRIFSSRDDSSAVWKAEKEGEEGKENVLNQPSSEGIQSNSVVLDSQIKYAEKHDKEPTTPVSCHTRGVGMTRFIICPP